MAAVQSYLKAVEAGDQIDHQAFLAQHAAVADELRDWLAGLAFVDSAISGIRRCESHESATEHLPVAGDIDLSQAEPLGDFRLCRPIGRGGMGVVYEAVQLSLGRRVAVKILPLAAALDSRQLQRFKNEAYAAAQLHHTNIVPVYAIGCERSVHFYAMQLIEGLSLGAVVAALRQQVHPRRSSKSSIGEPENTDAWHSPAEPCEQPTPRPMPTDRAEPQRLQSSQSTQWILAQELSTIRTARRDEYYRRAASLGLQAAEALDYAHRQGVVHRDIKPQNLLLDSQHNLWITDFGLAHFYSDARLTQTGAMVGTLRYMAPEQASGEGVVLDGRADVYSLGMTLYELLTLEPALPGKSHAELLHQIASLEPRSPRSIDRAIPVELETIVSKASAKDPQDRYRTAGELADDLRRFLRDEPIRARPPSLWDSAVKWTRRHKAVAASSLIVLLLATFGSLVSTAIIAREQGKTRAALIREQQQRQEAERSFRRAREVVDSFTRIAVEDMDGPEFVHVRRQMLYAASVYYQQFLKEHADDPTIAADLATAQRGVNTIHSEILADLSAIEGFFRLMSLTELLATPSIVDDELQLSIEQKGQARELADELRRQLEFPRLHELMRQSPGQKRMEVAELNERAERGLSTVLSPGQLGRLRQIALQDQGPLAFTEPDVVARLGLTAVQIEAVRTVQNNYRESLDRGIRSRPGFRGERSAGESTRLKNAAVGEILAHLDAKQLQAWTELHGAPADLSRMMPFPLRPLRGPPHEHVD